MSPADSSLLAENRELLVAVAAAALVFVALLGVLGFGNVFGLVSFLLYAVVWLAFVGVVLWLFYRLVVAAERIASAQERIARVRESRADAAGRRVDDSPDE